MARILPLFIMAGVIGVALTILVTLILTQESAAQTEQGSLACVDSNNNGKVDIGELFNVIDQYFSSDPIPAQEQGSLTCVDLNNNGRVDIGELFNVIDQYFSSDPIPTPDPTPTTVPTQAPTLTPTPTTAPTLTPEPTVAEQWMGLTIATEDRCSTYDPDDYPYSASVEDDIVAAYGGVYGPYTGTWFQSQTETDIEHIIARSEAHDSGLCEATGIIRRQFANDLDNLTLASPSVNRHQKVAKDAAEWLPPMNQCWFADTIVKVREEYGLTIDQAEVDALEDILADCTSVDLIFAPRPSTPTPTPTPTPSRQVYASCEAAEAAGEPRIQGSRGPGWGFPAWMVPSARDGDSDGVVCEQARP